jgi:hypothetical protein
MVTECSLCVTVNSEFILLRTWSISYLNSWWIWVMNVMELFHINPLLQDFKALQTSVLNIGWQMHLVVGGHLLSVLHIFCHKTEVKMHCLETKVCVKHWTYFLSRQDQVHILEQQQQIKEGRNSANKPQKSERLWRRRMCWSWDSSLKLNFTLTELNSNSIEDRWDANWCKKT